MASFSDCIQTLFEQQAHRSPEGVALICGNDSVTYGELNLCANQLAHAILRQQTGTGKAIIGLFSDRSFEMVVGILGILKSGAAYLPLNPDYPRERLELLVHDSQIDTVVVPRRIAGQLSARVANILEIPRTCDATPADNPAVNVDGEDLAYVIYTSGSTGMPKAVCLAHRGLCRLMEFTREQMCITAADRILQFASFTFDASVWEVFTALTSGATLVLGNRDSLLPGPDLHALLTRHGVTIALFSPSVLSILLPEGLDALRILVAGSEKCTADIVARWSTGRRFFNAYGPTETTIYSTIYEVERPSEEAPPIGRAIPGAEVFVLDDDLRPVPPGAPGELWIGGIGVGREYLNRPQLTAEKFCTLIIDGKPRRLYRTGDQARFLPDGNLEYLGRRDFQVKIRGFRIELREVEAALESHESIASAVVTDGTDSLGNKELWAYYRCSSVTQGQEGMAPALRTYLSTKLPDYMIPSQFTQVERWPLTANGKLDRHALPAPTRRFSQTSDGSTQGTLTPTETRLVQLCEDLLGGTSVRRSDELGELGFHSLLIAQLIYRVRATFGVTLTFSETHAAGTVEGLARKIDESSSRSNEPILGPVESTASDKPARASFAQERIWFLERIRPACQRAYHFQSLFTIDGRLDVNALEEALNELVSRHEILRTTFVADEDGWPVQRVHPPQPFALPVQALDGTEEECVAKARCFIDSELQQLFDLERLPLIYWRLYRLRSDKHLLLHREHHFVHDGWSYGVFLREVRALYADFRAGRSPSLPPPAIQYVDFSNWQRRHLRKEAYQEQLAYWAERLSGMEGPPPLPADYVTPPESTFKGHQLRLALDKEVYARLTLACRQEKVTVYTWLHTVFQTFLHRYTGQHDLCVGTGFANRRTREVEGMLGMVINTVLIRGDFSGSPTFREMLHRFRASIVEAADNQDVPFEQVVRRLNPERAGGEARLFNTFFDSYDLPFSDFAHDLTVDAQHGISNGSAKFDLVALVIPRTHSGVDESNGNGVVDSATIIWECTADLFSHQTAERMLRHFRNLLDASLANPAALVGELSMAAADENRLIAKCERPDDVSQHSETSVLDLFQQQVERRPDSVAVEHQGERLSYGDLNARANRLASYLRKLGVRPEVMVGICASRSIQMIVGILGILKSGGAYVPLDPDYPRQRLAYMMRETKMPILLTESHLLDRLPAGNGQTVCLDRDWEGIAAESSQDRKVNIGPHSLAYVIFTSGSTGQPKGTKVEHSGIVRLVHRPNYVELGSNETLLQFAPISFDASTFEIWAALLNGAKLVVFPSFVPSLSELADFIARNRITTLWLTAGLFHQMVEHHLDVIVGVRQLLAGGDVLSLPHVKKTLASLPTGHRLINGYGPTENTTFTCCHVMDTNSQIGRSVPIGRPISGSVVYILDERMQRVPIGVPGELYVGGKGLAREYLNQPQLTAETFVANPFPGQSHSRLYKTGDQCRWLADGTIEFLGRRDRQIKIRGFRVELGEIEAVVLQHPAVSDAVAMLRMDQAGDRQLIAYVVPVPNTKVLPLELCRFAAEKLPSYMHPQGCVVLDTIPLTPNGKVDHAKLPPPQENRTLEGEAKPPVTAEQTHISSIWRDILRVNEVGVDDNFFDLGGHSLLAMQVISRLRDAYAVNISLLSFFESPTVAGLADLVATAKLKSREPARAGNEQAAVPARDKGDI